MIEQKQNDLVLNLLANLDFSTADFKAVGLTADNTSLLDKEVYKSSKQILDIFQREDGTFDNESFNKFYENALITYNVLANDTYIDDMYKESAKYGKDNIFAPRELRRTFSETVRHLRVPNPDRTTTGLIRVGETANPTMSRSEIAQTLKVLTNPTEVYDINGNADWEKAIWHEAPNDSWFEDFWDTRVLALWELDGEHIDPITGKVERHLKGLAKLNEEGTYYYENLDGRDIYGKLVLNKMNTLTTDGSFWNKYDFFDSDGLDLKSITGSVLKNVVLVGSMFIPYVGPWIAGLSVASLLAGLSGTLGKMLTGSDSPTFSALEGWAKSVNRQTAKSQYAMENTWCWENFINLIGDVAGQLKEQRFLFEYAPALFKGDKVLGLNGISKSKQSAYALERAKYHDDILNTKFRDMQLARNKAGKPISATEFNSYTTAKNATSLMGNADLEKFMKSYQHIGEVLSKGYMTAITVGDTYGEAKYEGHASDLEATLLTLGYAAMEAALLNTGVGEWILPELKASGLKTKAIINALTDVPESMRLTSKNILAREGTKESAKYWFNKGKEIAEDLMSKGKGLAGLIVSGGLGEGVEEVSEELLADFSRSCFNVVLWLQGSDNRMSAWDNMTDRYLMSLLGGAVGGGITAAGTNFKVNVTSMDSKQAMQELVYMLREDRKSELFNSLNKMTLADPYRLLEFEKLSDGTTVFKPSNNETSNMDKDIKLAFVNLVNIIDNIVKAEGIKLNDNAFLDILTFKDIRLAALQNSSVSGLFLQDFNSLCSEIVKTVDYINTLSKKPIDSASLTPLLEDDLRRKNQYLLELRTKKDLYTSGELAMDYTSLSLFEMTPIVSLYFTTMFFKDYVEKKYNKKINTLSDTELKQYREEFDNWKNNEGKNDVVTKGRIYLDMARNSGAFIQEFAKNYDSIRKSESVLDLIRTRLKNQTSINTSIDPENNLVNDTLIELDTWLDLISKLELLESVSTAVSMINSKGNKKTKEDLNRLLQALNTLDKNNTLEWSLKSKEIADFISREISENLDTYFDEFINLGAINPEIKNGLLKTIHSLKAWTAQFSNNLKPSKTIRDLNNNYVQADENTYLLELKDNEDLGFLQAMFGEDIEDVITFMQNSLKLLGIDKEDITIGDIEFLNSKINAINENLDKKLDALSKISYTDSINFILNFILTNSDSKLEIAKLLETVNQILYDNLLSLSSINLMEVVEQIDEAIEVIGWLLGLVIGALSDSDAGLDNLIGYNITLNEIAKKHGVKDWEALPIISTLDSYIIHLDLQLIKNKLIHAKNIHAINQNKKLNLLNRVATNKNYIVYNRLKRFIVNIDDSWAEKELIELAINGADVLKLFAEKRLQTTEVNRKLMEKEMLKIEDAFYNFFNNSKNSKKIQDGELYTLFLKNFDLYNDTDQLINEYTEIFEDRNLLYWLASRAAIKKSAFNNELRQTIDPESGIAPIPTQQEAVFHNIAEILNGDLITSFIEGYKKAVLLDWEGRSRDSKKDLLVNRLKRNEEVAIDLIDNGTIKNIDIFPKYSNIYLTEGIPGSGKSKAVDYYTVQILKLFHGDILKDAWLVNNTVSNAEKLAKSLDVKFRELFDKTKFMSRIFSKYNPARRTNSKGAYIYDISEWTKTEDGEYRYNAKSDDLTNVPSLIIIDEISHYDLADLEIINDFAKKYGITVITSGDFLQSTALALFKEGDSSIILTPTRGLFKHSPKLGVSIRSNNSQMDKTITSFLAHPSDSKNPIDTYYYIDDNNFNGVKQVLHNEESEIEKIIDLMISTAKVNPETGEKEKIGFIYFDDDSPSLKILERKYVGKFEKFKGTAAQGLEGLYYIIDFHGSERNPVNKKQDLYTGISRAEQGALVIYTANLPTPQELQQHQETATTKTGFDEKNIKSYAIDSKKLLDELCGDSKETILRKERSKTNSIKPAVLTVTTAVPQYTATPTSTSINWDKPNEVMDFIYKGIKYATDGVKVGKYNNSGEIEPVEDSLALEVLGSFKARMSTVELDLVSELDELELGTVVHEESTTELPSVLIDRNNFTILLHTHNTFELGLKINSNRNLEFLDALDRYEYRIDSAIGLIKIYELDWKNPKNDADFYILKIALLRNTLFSIPDKNALINYLSIILDDDVSELEFGLVSSPRISDSNVKNGQKWGYKNNPKKFGKLDKHSDETTLNNNVDNSIGRKTINALITLTNGKQVSIPLFVLGNLETYTRDPKNLVSLTLKTIYDRVKGDSYKFHEEVLNEPNLPLEIYNLAKLWVFTNGAYFKVDDSSWTPAKNLQNWGIQVNTNAISGKKYPYNGKDSFRPIKEFLKETGFHFSKQIYTTLSTFTDTKGNEYSIANKGHAFILVSQDPSIITDQEMEDLYKKQLLDSKEPKKVTRVYIMPPKVSISKYLQNLYNLVNEADDRSKVKKLGSHLTSYYIWRNLLDKLDDPLFNSIDKLAKEKLKNVIQDLKAVEDAINSELDLGRKVELKNDLLNRITGTESWEGVSGRTTQSVLEHLNYQLLKVFMSMGDNSIIVDNFNKLVQFIEESGIEHIFYSPKFKNKIPTPGLLLIPLESDLDLDGNSLYTIDGLDFLINAKLDSNLFSSVDFNSIIDAFVKKILPTDTKHDREWTLDTLYYVNGKQNTSSSSTNIRFKLEANDFNIDYIDISINNNIVTINGIDTTITPELVKNIKVFSRDEIRIKLLNSGSLNIDLTDYINNLYNLQISQLSQGNINAFDGLFKETLIEIANSINLELSNRLAIVVDNKVIIKEFTQNELELLGLKDGIKLNLRLDFKESEVTISYNGVNIIFNKNNETISLISEQNEPPNEPQNKTINLSELNVLDDLFLKSLEDLNVDIDKVKEVILNGFESYMVSELRGLYDFVDILNDAFLNNKDDRLATLIDYFKEESDNCIINISK